MSDRYSTLKGVNFPSQQEFDLHMQMREKAMRQVQCVEEHQQHIEVQEAKVACFKIEDVIESGTSNEAKSGPSGFFFRCS